MGRLNVTSTLGDKDGDGDYDALYSFGARSFSVWNATSGQLVFDSKNELDIKAKELGVYDDTRSDDKSIEPESITIGRVGSKLVAYVGLERVDAVAIYDITNPLVPVRQSLYTHITSCDPVVANDKFAYVTLSSGQNVCNRGLNQLEVIDISNKKQPKLLQTIAMSKPQGLALSGNDLFVCDDKVKWFDTSASPTLTPKGIINIKAHDAIITGKILMLVGEGGLSQYDFSGAEPKLLSEIKTGN